jgi:hypothetical protein
MLHGINDWQRIEHIRANERLELANSRITQALRILKEPYLTHKEARKLALEALNGKV